MANGSSPTLCIFSPMMGAGKLVLDADGSRFVGRGTYASRHLSANDYYAEEERIQGHWMGHGAELLELKGEVTLEQFDSIRQSLHPETREFLRPRQNVDRFDRSLPDNS